MPDYTSATLRPHLARLLLKAARNTITAADAQLQLEEVLNFSPDDLIITKANIPRWWHRVLNVVRALRTRGIILPDSPTSRFTWTLANPKGIDWARDASATADGSTPGGDAAYATRVRLVRVKTVEELADNFIRFQQEARRHRDRTIRIFRRTEYWVCDENSGAFGPGKFLGYSNMDFATYEQASSGSNAGAKFNGGTARLAIEDALGGIRFAGDKSLDQKCREWGLSLLGDGAWGGTTSEKWKFFTVPIQGREPVTDFPDEVSQPELCPEGALRFISINAYERSRKARALCVKHYGASCNVCGLEFSERYGEIGDGFIHVHHLKMLSKIGVGYTVDPVADLRPVCPNCHAMLHRASPPMSIAELKSRLRQ